MKLATSARAGEARSDTMENASKPAMTLATVVSPSMSPVGLTMWAHWRADATRSSSKSKLALMALLVLDALQAQQALLNTHVPQLSGPRGCWLCVANMA